MLKYSPVFALLLLVISASGSLAVETPTSVRDLVVIGLEKNIGLQVEQLNIPSAEEAVVIEEAEFDAEIFASLGYSDASTPLALSSMDQSDAELFAGQVGVSKNFYSGLLASISLDSEWAEDNNFAEDLDPRYRTAFNLNLTQPLLRNFGAGVNTTNLQISLNQQNQASLGHLLQAQTLALQVELLTSQLAGESVIVSLRKEAVSLAEELLSSNKRRFAAGVIPVSEVQEAETSLANRLLEVSLAHQSRELRFENLNRQLNHVLRRDLDTTSFYSYAQDSSRLTLPEFEPLYAAARDKNVSLQVAKLDIRNSDLQHAFFQNQLKPQLDLNFQAGVNGLSGDERNSSVNNRFSGSWDQSLTRAAEADGYQWSTSLQFSVPLGNRQAKARLRQADLRRKQASYRQRDLESELRSELQQQVINVRRSVEQVRIAERFEELAKVTLQQEQRRLEEGLSDTFRMIIFQNSMIEAKIGRINALVQYYSSVAQLSFTRGTILEQHNITLQQQPEENNLEIM